MNSLIIYKQLIINSIELPLELLNEVKNYLFYDKISAESKNKKRRLINQFKRWLWYQPDFEDGHWALCYRYEIQMQGINCRCCGQFKEDFSNQPSMTCFCDQEYVEEIMEQVSSRLAIRTEEDLNEDFDNYMERINTESYNILN